MPYDHFAGCLLLRIGNDGPRGRDACQRRIRRPVRNRSRQPYTAADLDWTDRSSRSTKEMNDEASRPAMKVDAPPLDGYDTIFVGFPIWWYVEPRIIDTFLESADFAGKIIVPFATSGGSGLGKAPERMASLTPGATVLPGKLLNGGPSDTTLRTWIENL